jgi:hypothetical protein
MPKCLGSALFVFFNMERSLMFRIFCLLMSLACNHVYAHDKPSESWLPIVRDLQELDPSPLPKNYRTTELHHSDLLSALKAAALPTKGLPELKTIGSGQYTEEQLRNILDTIDRRLLLVDLREEVHLLLETTEGTQLAISGFAPLNVGNEGRSLEEIAAEHERYRQYILELGVLPLPFAKGDGSAVETSPPIVQVHNVYTEEEIANKLNEDYEPGIEYRYLPVTDHKKPTVEIVDHFVDLMRDTLHDQELLVLFHCRAGRGRTGMMMVMRDILQNAKQHQLSLHQIFDRQELLGSPNFSEISMERSEQSLERYEFLQHFYNYAVADDGFDSGVSYSQWLDQYPQAPVR